MCSIFVAFGCFCFIVDERLDLASIWDTIKFALVQATGCSSVLTQHIGAQASIYFISLAVWCELMHMAQLDGWVMLQAQTSL